MDRRIRELERLAAIGDIDAQDALIQHWGRAGLVPTDDHIELMKPCGFAVGGDAAVPIAVKMWCRLLRNLADLAHLDNVRGLGGIQTPVYLAEQRAIKRGVDTDIGDANIATFPAMLYGFLSHDVYPYINMMLDDRDLPPLFLHHNELTGALLTGFSCPTFRAPIEEVIWSPMGEFLTTVSGTKLYLIVRKIEKNVPGTYRFQATVYWNLPSLTVPTNLFSDLPDALQQQPGIWSEWGWGACNNQERDYGRWDYNPIVQELGSMHWLRGGY